MELPSDDCLFRSSAPPPPAFRSAWLSKIENGTISPSLSTIGALAKALNVSIASLFAESDERRDCSLVEAGQGLRTPISMLARAARLSRLAVS